MSKELFDLSSDRDKFSTTFGKDLLYPKKGDDEPPKKDKKQVDLAGIISASALGLDSITSTRTTTFILSACYNSLLRWKSYLIDYQFITEKEVKL